MGNGILLLIAGVSTIYEGLFIYMCVARCFFRLEEGAG
jgi:hypothetical protein